MKTYSLYKHFKKKLYKTQICVGITYQFRLESQRLELVSNIHLRIINGPKDIKHELRRLGQTCMTSKLIDFVWAFASLCR